MIDAQKLDDLVRKLSESLPEGLKEFDREAKTQFKRVLESGFERMNLVSREEFDLQVKILQKTRAKVDALEAQLKTLEEALEGNVSKSD